MKKAFTLPTCKTCQRIFDDLQPEQLGCDVVDIKADGISAEDLDAMKPTRARTRRCSAVAR